MIGTFLEGYRLVEELGAGTFATVCRAKARDNRSPAAVKVFKPEYAGDAGFRRFEREARVALSLTPNAHLARPLHNGFKDGVAFFAIEYVSGNDLSALLDSGKGLPIREVISIGMKVADALRVAHTRAVIHRDIKPQNIRVTPAGLVKVLDFGIARPLRGTRVTQMNEHNHWDASVHPAGGLGREGCGRTIGYLRPRGGSVRSSRRPGPIQRRQRTGDLAARPDW